MNNEISSEITREHTTIVEIMIDKVVGALRGPGALYRIKTYGINSYSYSSDEALTLEVGDLFTLNITLSKKK